MTSQKPIFLLSIDLEDPRSLVPAAKEFPDRLFINVKRYIDFFARHNAKVTFFVVGEVALNHPDVIALILQAGHEVACHGSEHIQLDNMTSKEFEKDLKRTGRISSPLARKRWSVLGRQLFR